MKLNIREFLNKFNSTYCSNSLDFEIVESNIDVRKIHPTEREFYQVGYEIIPTYKIISDLPEDAHESWTLETYQAEVINQIDLNAFHCFCLWSGDGIVIANELGEICFQATFDFLEILGITIIC